MTPDHRERLRSIKDFRDLVAYLHDELDWPVGDSDFEDLTYEYTPEELGIDEANAAKIQEIKRLRPLIPEQPWGIFFVSFEPKRLPVVALRRILGSVAVKRRASANPSDRLAWNADDLLFISNFGEGTTRQVSFAHFSVDQSKDDLPTLKVLGWDDRDTPLHLDAVADTLRRSLAWPEDPTDTQAWRGNWSTAFSLRHREVITTSRALAERLAELARGIRQRILTALRIETEAGPVSRLMVAFKESLIHDLSEDDFADMYAQTIAYGLLSARVAHPTKNTAGDLASSMPATTPFLKELMETFLTTGGRKSSGLDFDELGIADVVNLLDQANMEAVLRDFGDNNREEDPVIHFYELFLREYDAEKRLQRGVFYTPRPVVSFIVRSVHAALQTEFGLSDGLADTSSWADVAERNRAIQIPEGVEPSDPFVTILDPATGTGTFLVEAIDVIHQTLTRRWEQEGRTSTEAVGLWNEYVSTHLLSRLYGFELLMAPYAIAHLKVGLKLRETGYQFGSKSRLRVFLTNTLEPAQDFSDRFDFGIPALAHEARAVNDAKRNPNFTVILGNPPYAGHSSNQGAWIQGLVDEYFQIDGERLDEANLKWLRDDYVKFIRFGQEMLRATGVGIISFITNHGYIDNPTFRGMRVSLIRDFANLRVLDLHGNTKKRDTADDGSADQNVFDIQQGVAIFLGRKGLLAPSNVSHSDLRGNRECKYAELGGGGCNLIWNAVQPCPPFYLLAPQDQEAWAEYESFASIAANTAISSLGVLSKRDSLVVGMTEEELLSQVTAFADPCKSDTDVTEQFGVPLADKDKWNMRAVRSRFAGPDPSRVRSVLYRPFDKRYLYYDDALVARPNRRVLRNLEEVDGNLALLLGRQGMATGASSWDVCFATSSISDQNVFRRGGGTVFPLWLAPPEDGLGLVEKAPNFATSLLSEYAGLGAGPEQVFAYAYAIFHSPAYRSRYSEFLKIDFPRLPAPVSKELLDALVLIGRELINLHVKVDGADSVCTGRYAGPANPEVGRVSWTENTVWLDAARGHVGSVGFRDVLPSTWEFTVGGYQVCEKWLKDRKGLRLTSDDIESYCALVAAVDRTIELMGEVDGAIVEHGGWPAAFASSEGAASERVDLDSTASLAAEAQASYANTDMESAREETPSGTLWSDSTQLRGKY